MRTSVPDYISPTPMEIASVPCCDRSYLKLRYVNGRGEWSTVWDNSANLVIERKSIMDDTEEKGLC